MPSKTHATDRGFPPPLADPGPRWRDARTVLICCHDAGGAEILSAWVLAQPGKAFRFLLEGPAVTVFRRKLKELVVLETAAAYAGLSDTDFVLTGTSWGSNLEFECLARARECGVFSAAFLDHWLNYPERFVRGGVQRLPDELWVGDDDAAALAGRLFPATPIRQVPNPYFAELKLQIAAFPRASGPAEGQGKSVLFVCENISDHARLRYGDERHWGYTELEAIEYFFEHLAVLDEPIDAVILRPHPSDAPEKYAEAIARRPGLARLGGGATLLEEIAAADLVVGCESVALTVGLLAGKRVISCIPPGGPDCRLPQANILRLRSLAQAPKGCSLGGTPGKSDMNESNLLAARSNAAYDAAADKHGTSSRAVFWDDPQTQYLRFSELVTFLNLNDERKTLLDVGCGNGELYKFLNFVGFRGRYTGYDINEKLLAQARSRFRGIDVQCRDIMGETTGLRFDYVVMSGLFNRNVGQSTDWIHGFVKSMFALCSDAMVFNMISTHVTYRDEEMFYVDPADMFGFCIKNLSRRTTVSHHNLPFNFTVAVFRNDVWQSVKETAS